jgi:serine/threonine-protein kinase
VIRLRGLFLLVTVLLLSLAGCAGPADRIYLPHWELQASRGPVAIDLPAHVTEQVPSHESDVRLTAHATLPPDERGVPWVLAVPYIAGQARLLVNGEEAVSLESNVLHGYRAHGPQTFLLDGRTTRAPDLELTLVVHSTWTQATWIDTVPRLFRLGETDPAVTLVRIANGELATVATTVVLVMGIVYLAVFFTDTSRKAYLWAGVQTTLSAYYGFFITGASQLGIGHFEESTEAIALVVAPIAGVYFSHEIFGLKRPTRAWLVLGALSIAPPALLHDPFVTPRWVVATIACIVVVVVYQVVVCLRLMRSPSPPPGARILLAAWLLLGVTSSTDFTGWLGLGDVFGGARGGPLGLTIFGVLQAVLLSRRHAHSLRDGDALNLALRGRVDELVDRERDVRHLNEELRRQIGDRSRQLFTALAVIGGRGAPVSDLVDGMVIEGRYLVVRKIGEGGMGAVYEVRRLVDGLRLALKVALNTRMVDLSRLAREAHMASRVSHPNVVRVFDVDVATEGFLYIVLEYVDARSLARLRGQTLDVSFVTQVLLQIASGLQALHAEGIVHRDLKPENVVVVRLPNDDVLVKLLDFGISREAGTPVHDGSSRADEAAERVASSTEDTREIPQRPPSNGKTPSASSGPDVTNTGTLFGTPRYIAPELAAGGDRLSPAADIFAFGVLAFELFTRSPPFEIPLVALSVAKLPIPVPPRLLKLRKDVPPPLATLIDDCLSVRAEDRPTTDAVVATLKGLV